MQLHSLTHSNTESSLLAGTINAHIRNPFPTSATGLTSRPPPFPSPGLVTFRSNAAIRNPPGIPISCLHYPSPPSLPLHPHGPFPKQVRPTLASMTPSHSTLKSAREIQLPLTKKEDQTFEMYKDSTGKISVGREEAGAEVVSCVFMPTPLHIMRPSESFLPRTHLRGTPTPYPVTSQFPSAASLMS